MQTNRPAALKGFLAFSVKGDEGLVQGLGRKYVCAIFIMCLVWLIRGLGLGLQGSWCSRALVVSGVLGRDGSAFPG